jgi:hypothetical protein
MIPLHGLHILASLDGALSRGWSNGVRTQPCWEGGGQGWMIPLRGLHIVAALDQALSRGWSNGVRTQPCEGQKWAGLDSNQRRHKPADLQSAPFGHSGTYPKIVWGWFVST